MTLWCDLAAPEAESSCDILSGEHLHDLGKLMMGFSTFWAYMWFSQYMLIWYSNMPEETGYYVTAAFEGTWNSLFILNLVVNWADPLLRAVAGAVEAEHQHDGQGRRAPALRALARSLPHGHALAVRFRRKPGRASGSGRSGMLLGVIGVVAADRHPDQLGSARRPSLPQARPAIRPESALPLLTP